MRRSKGTLLFTGAARAQRRTYQMAVRTSLCIALEYHEQEPHAQLRARGVIDGRFFRSC
jgi:hypothetical protein